MNEEWRMESRLHEQTEAWLIQATQGYRDVSTPGALHEDSSGRSAPHPTAQPEIPVSLERNTEVFPHPLL